jgi:hypothetical protein
MAELLNVSADAYHADQVADVPTLSASIAKILLAESPAHAWAAHPHLNPDYVPVHKPEFDIGTAVHRLFLEPKEESKIVVVLADSWRTKAAQEQRDEARDLGYLPLLEKDMIAVEHMVEQLRLRVADIEAEPPIFGGPGFAEQTLVWNEDGVACRSRIDWMHQDYTAIDDLKTTSVSANPQKWARQLYSMNYDVQAQFYERAVTALAATQSPRFVTPVYRLAIIEKQPPYALTVMQLSPAGRVLANAKVDRALLLWKRCLESGVWPGYPQTVATAEPPAWAEEQFWASMEGETP